jgi:hypothetical protein
MREIKTLDNELNKSVIFSEDLMVF